MNRIEKVLKKIGVPYSKYGEKEDDAIDIIFENSVVTLSAFDNELEICTAVERPTENGIQTGLNSWQTYDNVIQVIFDCIVNKEY